MRLHLGVLQDMETIVEINSSRQRLMNSLRARISDIERTLQQIRSERLDGHLGSLHTPPSGIVSETKKKVVLDESDARLELHERRMAKLKTLAGFNPEDETMAKGIDSEIQQLSAACKIMFNEEQLNEAPSMAVILFHKPSNTYRLFFVCSYTLQVVRCGPNGEGFVFKKSMPWYSGAKNTLIFCTMALNCGIISHPFDDVSGYDELCDSSTSRSYLLGIIEHLKSADERSITEQDNVTKETVDNTIIEPSLWNLFGSLQCASGVFAMTGQFMLDSLDSGVGACTRVFSSDLGRINGDIDCQFILSVSDIRKASISFNQMAKSIYQTENWKGLANEINLTCYENRAGILWIDIADMTQSDFKTEYSHVSQP